MPTGRRCGLHHRIPSVDSPPPYEESVSFVYRAHAWLQRRRLFCLGWWLWQIEYCHFSRGIEYVNSLYKLRIVRFCTMVQSHRITFHNIAQSPSPYMSASRLINPRRMARFPLSSRIAIPPKFNLVRRWSDVNWIGKVVFRD